MTRGEIVLSSGDNDPVAPGSCFTGVWRELGWLIESTLEWNKNFTGESLGLAA